MIMCTQLFHVYEDIICIYAHILYIYIYIYVVERKKKKEDEEEKSACHSKAPV